MSSAKKRPAASGIARRTPERSAAPVAELLPQRSAQVRKRQDKFLTVFASVGTIAGAVRLIGKGKKKFSFSATKESVRLWRRDDPAFAAKFEALDLDVTGLLEDGTMDDALGEYDPKRGRFIGGNPILKIFLLKSRNPEKYRDNIKVEHAGGVTVKSLLLEDDGK